MVVSADRGFSYETSLQNDHLVLTLGLFDDSLEFFASMAELAHPHAGTVVVEEALGGLLQDRSRQGRRPSGHVVHLGTVESHVRIMVLVIRCLNEVLKVDCKDEGDMYPMT